MKTHLKHPTPRVEEIGKKRINERFKNFKYLDVSKGGDPISGIEARLIQ